MTKLTASWVSNGTYGNAVAVGDLKNHARFVFASPPQSAKKVVVVAKEKLLDLDDKVIPPRTIPGVPEGPTKEFHGRIENGKFIASKIVSGKLSDHRNNEFRLTGPEGKNTIRAYVRDPERVSSHTLTLTTEHEVNGKPVKFAGKAELHVRFPLAMVIPSGTAVHDTALNTLDRYATGWQSHQPLFRHIVRTTMFRTANLPKRIEPTHFDALIADVVTAANLGTAGVVALAPGHGSLAALSSFINLVPEDKKGIEPRLHIQKEELFEGAQGFKKGGGIVVKPNRDVLVRLDALDRLGDALQKTKLRRLIFHTCRAGSDAEFMQLVANRLQVPVRGQKDYIWFSDDYSIYHSELTQAEKDDPTLTPTGLTSKHEKFWIVHKLSNIFFPKDAPQRYGVS